MTTKLTLSMQKGTVEKARRFSARHGKSVSKMMEDFINDFPETQKKALRKK